jgi:hypothetical protein
MNAGMGNKVFDYSKNGNIGTINGAIWAPGLDGHALSFNGSSDDVSLPDNLFDDEEKGTIIARVYLTDDTANHTIIASAANTIALPNNFFRLHVRLASGSMYPAVQARLNDNTMRTTNPIPLHTWVWLTLTSDGSTWRIFINGIEETLTAVTGSNTGEWFKSQVNGTMLYDLGVLDRSTGPIQYWKGNISAVTVYDQPLPKDEVLQRTINPYARFERRAPARYFFIPAVSPATPISGPAFAKLTADDDYRSKAIADDAYNSKITADDNYRSKIT